jgi:hypothetical protein
MRDRYKRYLRYLKNDDYQNILDHIKKLGILGFLDF